MANTPFVSCTNSETDFTALFRIPFTRKIGGRTTLLNLRIDLLLFPGNMSGSRQEIPGNQFNKNRFNIGLEQRSHDRNRKQQTQQQQKTQEFRSEIEFFLRQ